MKYLEKIESHINELYERLNQVECSDDFCYSNGRMEHLRRLIKKYETAKQNYIENGIKIYYADYEIKYSKVTHVSVEINAKNDEEAQQKAKEIIDNDELFGEIIENEEVFCEKEEPSYEGVREYE